jgi:hypothetical protein
VSEFPDQRWRAGALGLVDASPGDGAGAQCQDVGCELKPYLCTLTK